MREPILIHVVTDEISESSTDFETFRQPVCTCGWRGKEVSSMNNWQEHELKRLADQHIKEKTKCLYTKNV
jgi:hypothetical protein